MTAASSPSSQVCHRKNEYTAWTGSESNEAGKEKNAIVTKILYTI